MLCVYTGIIANACSNRALRKYLKYDEVAQLMDTLQSNSYTWNLPVINSHCQLRIINFPIFNRLQSTDTI